MSASKEMSVSVYLYNFSATLFASPGEQSLPKWGLVLKTNILYYTEHTLRPCYVITYVRWGIFFDELAAVLQIRRDNRDNFGIIIQTFTTKTYFVTHH